jgi:hypothetical protein
MIASRPLRASRSVRFTLFLGFTKAMQVPH